MEQTMKKSILYQVKMLLERITVVMVFMLISFLIATEQQKVIELTLVLVLMVELGRLILFASDHMDHTDESKELLGKEVIIRIVRYIGFGTTLLAAQLLYEWAYVLDIDNWSSYYLVAMFIISICMYVTNIGIEKLKKTKVRADE